MASGCTHMIYSDLLFLGYDECGGSGYGGGNAGNAMAAVVANPILAGATGLLRQNMHNKRVSIMASCYVCDSFSAMANKSTGLAQELVEILDADPEATAKLLSDTTPKALLLRRVVAACAEAGEKLIVFSELCVVIFPLIWVTCSVMQEQVTDRIAFLLTNLSRPRLIEADQYNEISQEEKVSLVDGATSDTTPNGLPSIVSSSWLSTLTQPLCVQN